MRRRERQEPWTGGASVPLRGRQSAVGGKCCISLSRSDSPKAGAHPAPSLNLPPALPQEVCASRPPFRGPFTALPFRGSSHARLLSCHSSVSPAHLLASLSRGCLLSPSPIHKRSRKAPSPPHLIPPSDPPCRQEIQPIVRIWLEAQLGRAGPLFI